MRKARAEYEKLLRSLDTETREIFRQHVERQLSLIESGGISIVALRKLADELQAEIRALIKSKSVIAIDFAKKVKAADFMPYLAEVQRLLVARNVPQKEAQAITSLPRISAVFGGGLDKEILDSVWNKVWSDRLNVDDRINLWSRKVQKETERIIKQGVAEGKSAYNISKELQQRFSLNCTERKAMFRLAAHTTNMCYQSAQAEISVQTRFVMGIRILRGVYGPASDNCDICDQHAGPADGPGKEYYKEDFGGKDADLFVMANMPGYHSNCNCGIETIYEDAAQFIKNARNGTKNHSYSEGWKLG